MKPGAWREDGWPLCPACGQDELSILGTKSVTEVDVMVEPMFCYACGKETVQPGEGCLVPEQINFAKALRALTPEQSDP
jgi:hypothetical protein